MQHLKAPPLRQAAFCSRRSALPCERARQQPCVLQDLQSEGQQEHRGVHSPSKTAHAQPHDGPIASLPAQRSSHFADTSEVPASAELPADTLAMQMQDKHTSAINARVLDTIITSAAPVISQAGLTRTFYKRHLPSPPAIAFSSQEGKQLFAEALLGGTMEGFLKLIEQFRTQDEPAFCGLASLAMVLNTLAIDPRRAWKGPWRWFHEQMLDCCLPITRVANEGIVLHQAGHLMWKALACTLPTCLARCNGAKVEVRQSGTFSMEEFREDVQMASKSESEHLIVSYSRKQFLQTGDGHFSPVGGYHEGRDLVLILDTARFKYPPHWVPLKELFEAMKHVDPTTGQSRGYLKMGAFPRLDSVLFTLERRREGWQQAPGFWQTTLPQLLASPAVHSGKSAVCAAVRAAPLPSLLQFIAVRQGSSCNDSSDSPGVPCSQPAVVTTLLTEIRGLELYRLVDDALMAGTSCNACSLQPKQEDLLAERLTVFLLLAPKEVWDSIPDVKARAEVEHFMKVAASSILATELEFLGNQQSQLPVLDRFDSMNAACAQCSCVVKSQQ